MTREEVVALKKAVDDAAVTAARRWEYVGLLAAKHERAEQDAREADRKHQAAVDALAKAVLS